MSILKPNPKESPGQPQSGSVREQSEYNQQKAFTWVGDSYLEKAVKMLCTNYDLETGR